MAAESGETCGRRKKRSICYFLLSLLEDRSYPDVQWTNKRNGEFQIHWKHASSGAWDMHNDAETFRLWAKAKGKLEGREDSYKTWKANFRCAMKSRPELKEMPQGPPHKRKNVKLWRFVDMEIVNKFEADGERFDWNRSQRRARSRKPSRTMKTRQSRNERVESDDGESLNRSPDDCDPVSSLSPRRASIVGLPTQGIDELNLEQLPSRVCMENDLDSYGAGLVRILEQSQDTDSVVPDIPMENYPNNLFPEFGDSQTETTPFTQDSQLPSFHSLMGEKAFSEDTSFGDDWHLFGDEGYTKQFIKEGITADHLDIPWDDIENKEDPFFYENTYLEL